MTKTAPLHHCASFGSIADSRARVLILGSMPGAKSLRAQQYYAHPNNSFWKIMGLLCGFDGTAPYAQRLAALTQSGIALWDVLQSCTRTGSLDSAIEADTVVANDFLAFFQQHPHIECVCFNGATAERYYMRQVLPTLTPLPLPSPLRYVRLPSTSPAHAALAFQGKLAAWRSALGAFMSESTSTNTSHVSAQPKPRC